MKAGTTTLFDHLAGHPAVAPSRDKEPKYFARDNVYAAGARLVRLAVGLGPVDPRDRDGGVDPLLVPPHPPRDRGAHGRPSRRVPPRVPRARAGGPRSSRTTTTPSPPGWKVADRPLGEDLHRDLVEPCRYAWQLDAYTAQFPRSSILVLAFEDLVADPHGTVDRVLAPLGPPGRRACTIDTRAGAQLLEHQDRVDPRPQRPQAAGLGVAGRRRQPERPAGASSR